MSSIPLCQWMFRGRPLLAYAAGDRPSQLRALHLFPRTTFKRKLFYGGIRLLMGTGMGGLLCARRKTLDELSAADLQDELEKLRAICGGTEFDWLVTWPAQADRRRVYLLFHARTGKASGVVKIGAGDFNVRQLRHEAETLRDLAKEPLPFSVPSVLFEHDLGSGRVALALGGFPFPLSPVSAAQACLRGQEVASYLAKRPVPRARMRAGDADWFSLFRDRAPAGPATQRLLGFSAVEIEVTFAHGDLGPGNMLDDGRGGVFLFDWENASAQAPVLTDPVGLWLACRQRLVLRSPRDLSRGLKMELGASREEAILCALAFLCAHGNLAASKMLEGWE